MSGDTKLKKVTFQPGYNRNTTTYAAENYYVDGNWVRFVEGRAEKEGGFVSEVVSQANDENDTLFTGTPRVAYDWVDLDYNKYLAQGSEKKIELMYGNQIYDITPYREELTLTDAISTTSGQSIVQITDVNHNLSVGEYIYVDSQATPVDGVTLLGEYTVVTVIDADNYTIDSGTVASGTTANAGGLLEINYPLEFGNVDNGNVTGYGGGTYDTPGAGGVGYGLPRAGVGGTFVRQISMDNWGEDLIACVREGKIYQWDATNGVLERMQALANAPERNLIAMVAQPSRHLVSFGCNQSFSGEFDPLNIRWASQETLTDWEITPTNTAGEYRLPKGNYIVAAIQTKTEILILTDSTAYSMRYVTDGSGFQFEFLADNVSAVSQHCGVDVNGIVYWMGVDGFYKYTGTVYRLPSSISDFLFDQDGEGRVNFDQKEKIYCDTNREFNEILWLFPDYTDLEINRYAKLNYNEMLFYDGFFSPVTGNRTVFLDKNVFEKPYAITSGGKLYIHEQGKDADGSPLVAYVTSGYVDMEDGDQLMFVDKFVPDFKLPPNRYANLYVYLKKYPGGSIQAKGPYTFTSTTGKVSIRGRARQVSVKYEVDAIGADFEVGDPRYSIQPDGGR